MRHSERTEWKITFEKAFRPSLMSYRDVVKSSFEVKAAGVDVIVSVCFELHASISEDGRVIAPGRFGQVHIP